MMANSQVKRLTRIPNALLTVSRWFGIDWKSDVELERVFLKIFAASVAPLLFSVQVTAYYKFFYSRSATFTVECCCNFLVCLVLDFLILWSHSKARQNPGYLSEIKQTGFINLRHS